MRTISGLVSRTHWPTLELSESMVHSKRLKDLVNRSYFFSLPIVNDTLTDVLVLRPPVPVGVFGRTAVSPLLCHHVSPEVRQYLLRLLSMFDTAKSSMDAAFKATG